ncbi:hypothetical protein CCS41_12275 [Candidatus Fukatsuia symbiotica]|uniref:Uncharacterized protein n=1 Tax=Candidatus Fukatsuia symbiotica TaxID=1878942 RepID=A0A2U8I7C6_9GAMM|nr:hypothetical protein CCS41_12275 [Candidatus Fukatsuia symbiotica]
MVLLHFLFPKAHGAGKRVVRVSKAYLTNNHLYYMSQTKLLQKLLFCLTINSQSVRTCFQSFSLCSDEEKMGEKAQ